jgi:hypothetical protein
VALAVPLKGVLQWFEVDGGFFGMTCNTN